MTTGQKGLLLVALVVAGFVWLRKSAGSLTGLFSAKKTAAATPKTVTPSPTLKNQLEQAGLEVAGTAITGGAKALESWIGASLDQFSHPTSTAFVGPDLKVQWDASASEAYPDTTPSVSLDQFFGGSIN